MPTAWENFYVIVGSSGAALTGIMFVVIALISDRGAARSLNEIDAFGTPTVVHFSSVLLLSAVLSAPWPSFTGPRVLLSLIGIAGVIYILVVLRRARRQKGYQPVFEDWIWHTVLPLIAYGAVAWAGVRFTASTSAAMFAIGGASVLLLFIGLHNAWDTVTWIVVSRPAAPPESAPPV